MRIPDLFQTLRGNPLLAVLSDAQVRDLESRLSVEYYALGDTVVRRGDEADGFYLIYSGRARVVDDSTSSRPITVAVLNKGDTFGEQALISRTPRSHTVR